MNYQKKRMIFTDHAPFYYAMQLVTPSVVANAVSMLISN